MGRKSQDKQKTTILPRMLSVVGMVVFVYRRALVEFEGAGVELVIGAAFCHELFVVATFDDAAVIHDHNNISVLNGGESVGNDKDGAPFHELIHPILHDGFGAGVDGGGGFVQNHDLSLIHI